MAICTHPVTVRRTAIELRCPLCTDTQLELALDDNARLRLDTDRLIHTVELLRAALKPFADWIVDRDNNHTTAGYGDVCPLAYSPDWPNHGAATIGDLRQARRVLEQKTPKEG